MKYRFGILGNIIHFLLKTMSISIRVLFLFFGLAFFIVMVTMLGQLIGGSGDLKYFIALVILSPSLLHLFILIPLIPFGDSKISEVIYLFVVGIIPLIGWILAFYSFIKIYGFLAFSLLMLSPFIFAGTYSLLEMADSLLENNTPPSRIQNIVQSKLLTSEKFHHHFSSHRVTNVRSVACEMALWSISELHKNEISLDKSMRLYILSAAWLIIYSHHSEHTKMTESKQIDKNSLHDFHSFFSDPIVHKKLSLDFTNDAYWVIKRFLMKTDHYIHSKQGKEKIIFEQFVKSCKVIAHDGGDAEKYRILLLPVYNTEGRNIILRIINSNAKELGFL